MADGKKRVILLLELKNRMQSGLSTAKKYLNENVQEMKGRLNSLRNTHIEAFKSMRDEIPLFGRAMDTLGNPYVQVIAGVTALTVLFTKAAHAAASWETGMAKANVTAQLSRPELASLSDQILEIGARNNTDLSKVPETFNKIISAGIDTNTALKTLEPTLKAARAGFADAEEVGKAVVSVMNSSGIMDANRVFDILFATINKGNAEFSDVAEYLPRIIPMAKQVGLSLEQVGGAYAYLTAQGMNARIASTALENVFKSLSDPKVIFGNEQQKGLKGFGIQVYDTAGKMMPLINVIEQIQKKTAGLTDVQKALFFDQIGFDSESGMAIASMTQNTAKLKEYIDFTTNSAGQLNEAIENAAVSTDGWKLIGNQLKKTMIEIGDPINKDFATLATEFLPLIEGGLSFMKDILLGIWGILKGVVEVAWAIIKPVAQAIEKTHLLQAAFWLLEKALWVVKGVLDVIAEVINGIVGAMKWVGDKLGFFTKTIGGAGNLELSEGQTVTDRNGIKYIVKDGKPVKESEYYGTNPKEFAPAPPDTIMPKGGVKADKDVLKILNESQQTKLTENGTKVSGKAEAVRNITINIGNLSNVEHMNVRDEKGKIMSKDEFEKWAKEMWMRMLRNFETSYS